LSQLFQWLIIRSTVLIKDKLHQVFSFPSYILKAKTAHGVHSPFVFGLINEVLKNRTESDELQSIEVERTKFLRNKSSIKRIDYGAGSSPAITFQKFAARSLCSVKYCKMLFRLAQYTKSMNALELGTALGITTAYLSKSRADIQIHTIEGDPTILNAAAEMWDGLDLKNVNSHLGSFDEMLPKILESSSPFDFVFVDGNHRKKPTLDYVEMIKSKLKENSVVIIDDIYWSREMTEAWTALKMDETFSLSVDLFRMGLLFKRPGVEKQDFVLYF